MIKTPVRGMRDLTPSEMILRDYTLSIIESVAASSGYQKIETPAVEHIENLTSKDGGENEALTFKILKRGQALLEAEAKDDDLVDSGLRYDLTIPLARYFANNQKNLPLPFKALQIGPAWRADRPQKGRFRQFLQCDMDILGDASILAEIDTILTTTSILKKIFENAKLSGLTIRLNDRRILTAALAFAGFGESDYNSALIALDKNDKIGLIGVEKELLELGHSQAAVKKFINLFAERPADLLVDEFCSDLAEFKPEAEITENLKKILTVVGDSLSAEVKVVFDPTLVRGMGYYTGPIFECSAEGFKSSVAGGGRYDKMIGKLSGAGDVPACGFSIGFERIVAILEAAGFKPPQSAERVALLVEREVGSQQLKAAIKQAAQLRTQGKVASIITMNKNLKYQIERLEQNGYRQFEKITANKTEPTT